MCLTNACDLDGYLLALLLFGPGFLFACSFLKTRDAHLEVAAESYFEMPNVDT